MMNNVLGLKETQMSPVLNFCPDICLEQLRFAKTFNLGKTFILLMCTFGRAPNNASKWEMEFNSVA
jgi:hypothetical protein